MLFKTTFALVALASTALGAPKKLQARVIDGAGWSVKSFTRTCNAAAASPSCTYQFNISQLPLGSAAAPSDFACHLVDFGPQSPPPADPKAPFDPVHNSFAASPCNAHTGVDGGWVISWGYDKTGDFAVMTVVNRDKQQDAFFGWNAISTRTSTIFEDVGPNKVYTLGTWT